MPISGVGGGANVRRGSDPTDVNQAQRNRGPGDGPGGVGGARPRAASTAEAGPSGGMKVIKALKDFFTRFLGGASSRTQDIKCQTENRRLLVDIREGKEPGFGAYVGKGVEEAMTSLEGLPHLPSKDRLESLTQAGLEAKPRTKGEYTKALLQGDSCSMAKEKGVTASAVGEAREKLGAAGASNNPITMVGLLASASQDKRVGLSGAADATSKQELQQIQQKLVQCMVSKELNSKSRAEASEEAMKECLSLITEASGGNQAKIDEEMGKVKTELKEAGNKLETALTAGNGGIQPIIPKADYETAMAGVVGDVGIRMGFF